MQSKKLMKWKPNYANRSNSTQMTLKLLKTHRLVHVLDDERAYSSRGKEASRKSEENPRRSYAGRHLIAHLPPAHKFKPFPFPMS